MRKCEICGRSEYKSSVVSSSLGAISFNTCYECSVNNAEIKSMIRSTFMSVDNDVAHWVTTLTYFEDNEYKKVGDHMDEFIASQEEIDEYFNGM